MKKDNVYAMENSDVKNKLNTLFLILLAEMVLFDLPFEIFRTFDASDNSLILLSSH